MQSHGDVYDGSASALFNGARCCTADPSLSLSQAEVDNHLPQTFSAGLRWQANRRAILSFEGGWSDWSGAFNNLPVTLKEGTNATINSVAGSAAIQEQVPLHWHDQGSFRAGIQVPHRQWTARAGYSYLSNPVPSATTTPLTAAILSSSVATGLGWQSEASSGHAFSSWGYDLAYQAQLPSSQSVGQSSLQAGEYSNSHIRVMTQSVTVSAHVNF